MYMYVYIQLNIYIYMYTYIHIIDIGAPALHPGREPGELLGGGEQTYNDNKLYNTIHDI